VIGLGWLLARRHLRGAHNALLAVAVLVATLLLFGAVSVRQGFAARAERAALRQGLGWSGPGLAPWAVALPFVAGDRDLTVIAAWAGPERSPALPGLSRNPAPGEVLASPALAAALRGGPDAELLRARLPAGSLASSATSCCSAPMTSWPSSASRPRPPRHPATMGGLAKPSRCRIWRLRS
jgi:hypothetical protein